MFLKITTYDKQRKNVNEGFGSYKELVELMTELFGEEMVQTGQIIYEQQSGKDLLLVKDADVARMLDEIEYEQSGKFIKKASLRIEKKTEAPPPSKNWQKLARKPTVQGLSMDTFRHIKANQEKIEQERALRQKIIGNVGKFLMNKLTKSEEP